MAGVGLWQRAARFTCVAGFVLGLAQSLAPGAISAQGATPVASTACQNVIEHEIATQTQRLLADCVTAETIFVSNGWAFDGGGHTIFAVDPPGGRMRGAVLAVHAGTGDVHDVVIDGSGLEEPCLIDGGASALSGLVFLNSTGEARRVTVRHMVRAFPRDEPEVAGGQSQRESCGTGIAVIGGDAQVTVAASVVSRVGSAGVLVEQGAATVSHNAIVRAADAGVLALAGARVRVTPGNQISYGRTGVFFEGEGTSGRVAGNTIVQMRGAGIVVMDRAHASLADNLITDATEHGVVLIGDATATSARDELARTVQGFSVLGGELSVDEPVISDCDVGVVVVSGSTAGVTGGDVQDCRYGLGASDAESRLLARDTAITGAGWAGVSAEAGGHVEVRDLRITHSNAGVAVLGLSSAEVADTYVADTSEAALVVANGGVARASGLEIVRPGRYGAIITRPGSTLTLSSSAIGDAEDAAVQVTAGGSLVGRSLRIANTELGLRVQGIGSSADLTDVAVAETRLHVLVEEGAQATVAQLASVGGRTGVLVRGPGARATIRESSIAQKAHDGVAIRDGGWASVAATEFTEISETAVLLEDAAPLFVPAVVTIGDEGCAPAVVTGPAGVRVRLTFHNATRETWEIEGPVLTARERLGPGEQLSLNVTGPASDLPFSCLPPDGGDPQTVLVRLGPAGQPAAWPGETVRLHANTFTESRNGIRISGQRRASISENAMSRMHGDGITLSDGAIATVRDNDLIDIGEAGILVEDGAQATVTANAITNTRTWGVSVTGAESSGTISRNEIRAAGTAGIGVSRAARATVLQNNLPASGTHGILVDGEGTSAAVWQNTVGPAPVGVAVMNGAVATVSRNQIDQTTGPGLTVEDAQVTANGNTFTGAAAETAATPVPAP